MATPASPAFTVWTQSCMTRIFPLDAPPERPRRRVRLLAARGEYECFQVGMHAPVLPADIVTEASDLRSPTGTIPAACVKVFHAGIVPVPYHPSEQAPGDLERLAPCFFPDPLHERIQDVQSPPQRMHCAERPPTGSLWVRLEVPRDAVAGEYSGRLVVRANGSARSITIRLHVLPFTLPRPRLHMTNWFFPDFLAKFCKADLLGETFWQDIELVAADMALHGQDTILTPLGGLGAWQPGCPVPQLIGIRDEGAGRFTFDFTAFDRWCEVFFRHGFRLIEGGHVAGGSRAATRFWVTRPDGQTAQEPEVAVQDETHRALLRQMLESLHAHLAARGWLEHYTQHVSDEPHGDQFALYSELVAFVRQCLPGVPLIDAMGDPAYSKLVEQPVPVAHLYEHYAAHATVPAEDIWCYTCCAPAGAYPNRFIDYPLVRVRIFPWLAWKHRMRGILHWGYNYWQWHPPVRSMPYNPYDNPTGGILQAGDNFIVYPPVDLGHSRAPVPSIRWEIIGKAMHDYAHLMLLDELEVDSGTRADEGETTAPAALRRAILKKVVPSFCGYTRDAELLLRTRARLAALAIAGDR